VRGKKTVDVRTSDALVLAVIRAAQTDERLCTIAQFVDLIARRPTRQVDQCCITYITYINITRSLAIAHRLRVLRVLEILLSLKLIRKYGTAQLCLLFGTLSVIR